MENEIKKTGFLKVLKEVMGVYFGLGLSQRARDFRRVNKLLVEFLEEVLYRLRSKKSRYIEEPVKKVSQKIQKKDFLMDLAMKHLLCECLKIHQEREACGITMESLMEISEKMKEISLRDPSVLSGIKEGALVTRSSIETLEKMVVRQMAELSSSTTQKKKKSEGLVAVLRSLLL